ncbi:MAG: hypothetical protein HY055_05735 [Magnetospirillum sp.]|nr:hypothetical protein [Magnetospirillum sp.]
MRTLVWSEEFSLGHERIDREHHRLIDLAAQIEAKAQIASDVADLIPLCKTFFRQLAAHCFYEEQLLRMLPRVRFGAQVDEHCRGHARLIDQAQLVLKGQLPNGFDDLSAFIDAYFQLMHDLLVDDTELVGVLIREGHHHLSRPSDRPGWLPETGIAAV